MSSITPIRHNLVPRKRAEKNNAIFRQYQTVTGLQMQLEFTGHRYCFQGGCTDGRYVYTAMQWENDANTILQKRSLDTYEVIAENNSYNYSHAGGMTYCSKDGYLYVSHAGGDNATVSRVDPDTMERVALVNCPSNIMNIAYNEVADLFVAAIATPYYYGVYKLEGDELRLVYHIKPENSPLTYGKQSLWCDSDFIFALHSDCIHVFTWAGEFVRLYDFPDVYKYLGERFEMEWCYLRNNRLTVGVYTGYHMGERINSVWSMPFDFYEDVESLIGKTGVENLNRAPAGTMVRLYGYGNHDGIKPIDLRRFIPCDVSAFKYLKIRWFGFNVGVTDWFKTGKLTLREFNLSDAGTGALQQTEMQMVLSDAGILSVEQNIMLTRHADGAISISTVPGSTSGHIVITEIWGVV